MHDSLNEGQLYVTVDMLILTVREGKLNLLLSRRKSAPYAGRCREDLSGWMNQRRQRHGSC